VAAFNWSFITLHIKYCNTACAGGKHWPMLSKDCPWELSPAKRHFIGTVHAAYII